MTRQELEEILRKNPHIDKNNLDEISRLIDARKKSGRSRNVYGIKSRLSAESGIDDVRAETGLER